MSSTSARMSETSNDALYANEMPVKVQFQDNRRGRGVVATRAFAAQECILAVTPTITVLYSPHASKLCAVCYNDVSISPHLDSINQVPSDTALYRCPTCDQFVLCASCVKLAISGSLERVKDNTPESIDTLYTDEKNRHDKNETSHINVNSNEHNRVAVSSTSDNDNVIKSNKDTKGITR
uniref:Uncharacterized protein n=2 Tax=Lygus hesperus TaxID=30085 RepID=A0A0A9VYJ7_LYGHE